MVPTKNPGRHDFVRNADIRCTTNQPPHSSIIKSRRLTFFGHLARMDDNAGIYEPPPENWRRPPGRPRTTWIKNIHDDLSSLNLGIHEARDLVVHATVGLESNNYAAVDYVEQVSDQHHQLGCQHATIHICCRVHYYYYYYYRYYFSFSALTLLVGRQEGIRPVKN